MGTGDHYRAKAADFLARADRESNPITQFQLENLGRSYIRLAEQADCNGLVEVAYEPRTSRSKNSEKAETLLQQRC